ncbi:BTAD domain-containing putative transcriptional regulator [Paracoccus liaowanqingii]|uniref:BTAD domain-containing putative transcriptional regulator n=1 Tax=Paracoccus liaowanqingii TaxID=2560053 RepID=UPI00159B9756|nr:BTAD domain-containing putative transcriptional regulator [Paracoccus liaowanqingii]
MRFELHRLRKVLGDAIGGDRRSVWLDPAIVTVDIGRFEQLVSEGTVSALSQACALYRGDLLADCELEDVQNDWLYPERERLRQLARSAFWALFSLYVWRGQASAAEQCAVTYLALDPYDERLHGALMRLRLGQGRRAAVAQQFANLSERLAHDLAVQPSSELTSLASRLNHAGRTRRRPFDAPSILGRGGEDVVDAPPLVAVSLFQNLSEQASLSVLSAALAEDIIIDLARFRTLAVLGRATAWAMTREPDLADWRRRFGVRYLVEGTVREAGNAIEVSVCLLSSGSERCLWADRFRGDLEGLPEFQENASRSIVAAVQVQVEAAELARIRHHPIECLSAYELYLRGRAEQRRGNPGSVESAFQLFSQAVQRDPGFGAAHAALALGWFGVGACSGSEAGNAMEYALRHAREAITLDPLQASGHLMHGMLLQTLRDFDTADHCIERALMLSPGDPETLAFSGLEKAYHGEAEAGAALVERAMTLEPGYPPLFAELMGKTAYIAGRYDSAVFWLRQSQNRVPTNRAWLAAAAARAGLRVEAAAHARAATATIERRLGPARLQEIGGPIAWLRGPARFRQSTDLAHYEEGLREAGLA